MRKKNSSAAFFAVLLAASLTFGGSQAGHSAEKPPLSGVFADNFTLLDEPVPAPEAAIQDGDGKSLTLAVFWGRVVLLNFWATWCAPCVHEMPTLDAVQADLRDEGLAVVAVSLDRGGRKVVAPFYAAHELDNLEIYLDPKGSFARAYGMRGLPTTMLVDRQGRIVGAMQGPADWDGPEAVDLIRHYLNQATPADDALLKTGG